MEFEKGILYFRVIGGFATVLFYPLGDVKEDHNAFLVKQIVELEGRGQSPCFRDVYENWQHGDRTSLGHLVSFEKATDENIIEMFSSWESGDLTITQWVEDIRKDCYHLLEKEKLRIKRLAQYFI